MVVSLQSFATTVSLPLSLDVAVLRGFPRSLRNPTTQPLLPARSPSPTPPRRVWELAVLAARQCPPLPPPRRLV